MAEDKDKDQEKVLIEHPDLKADRTGNPVEVTRAIYESIWKPRGWRLAPKKKES